MEHTIALIKPDGVERGIEPLVREQVLAAGLEILRCRRLKLTEADVLRCFHKSEAEYVDYMTRGECIALLVGGPRADEQMARIKKGVRQFVGLSWRDMENMLHHAECGNEFTVQLLLCFPRLDPLQYTGYADLTLGSGALSPDEAGRALARLDGNSKVTWVALVMAAEALHDGIDRFYRTSTRLHVLPGVLRCIVTDGTRVELVAYLPPYTRVTRIADVDPPPETAGDFVRWSKAWGGTTAIGYVEDPSRLEAVGKRLRDLGADHLVAYDPRHSPKRTTVVCDFANDVLHIPVVGGTAGRAEPGTLTVGQLQFEAVWNRLTTTRPLVRGGGPDQHVRL